MITFKKHKRSILYTVLPIIIILCIIVIPLTWYLTGKFPFLAISGIVIAASTVVAIKNRFNNYVALDQDRLIISAQTNPALSNDIYFLNEISRIEFRRENWLYGANYQIAITLKPKPITWVKTIGALGANEVNDLCEELCKRGLVAIVI